MTFLSPGWRSLSHLTGSLNHPKKVTKNCQVRDSLYISLWSLTSSLHFFVCRKFCVKNEWKVIPFWDLPENCLPRSLNLVWQENPHSDHRSRKEETWNMKKSVRGFLYFNATRNPFRLFSVVLSKLRAQVCNSRGHYNMTPYPNFPVNICVKFDPPPPKHNTPG